MMYLALFVIGFACLRLLISLWNTLSATTLPHRNQKHSQMVSVLIPARNEEKNLARLLKELTNSYHQNLEVYVYDDDSRDGTAQIVNDYARKDPRVKLIHGKDLPRGWTGKNYACYELGKNACGNCLLFLDADVTTQPELIDDLLTLQKQYELSLLSVFPVQIMDTPDERITVPFMNRTLLSLLPLTLIRRSPNPALAAANGQCMLFTKESYDKNQWHKRVANNPVEDINIMRRLKQEGEKGHTTLSNGQISCRMYHNLHDAIKGFAKNIHAYFGNNYLIMSLYLLITSFGFIPVWLVYGFPTVLGLILAESAIVLITSVSSGQHPVKNLLTAPLQQITAMYTAGYALMNKARGYGVWKGRRI